MSMSSVYWIWDRATDVETRKEQAKIIADYCEKKHRELKD